MTLNSTKWKTLLSCLLTTALLQACAPAPNEVPGSDNSQSGIETGGDKSYTNDEIDAAEYVMYPLSWESSQAPGRRQWSLYLHDIILKDWSTLLEGADDIGRFCPRYDSLNNDQKANVWAALFSAMTKYESGYNPASRMTETSMGTDPVTGSQVVSEGLLQLSYQDGQWAKWCDFEWSKDKFLNPKDPQKTILDPYKNLYCGVGIMARQVANKNKIAISSGVYWAVIRDKSSNTKLSAIIKMVKELPFCN